MAGLCEARMGRVGWGAIPLNSRCGVAAEERDGQRPGDAPNPRWDSKRTKARMAAGLLSEDGRWNAPRAEVTVSTGTVSFIPGPLAIRTEQQADDNKRTGD